MLSSSCSCGTSEATAAMPRSCTTRRLERVPLIFMSVPSTPSSGPAVTRTCVPRAAVSWSSVRKSGLPMRERDRVMKSCMSLSGMVMMPDWRPPLPKMNWRKRLCFM